MSGPVAGDVSWMAMREASLGLEVRFLRANEREWASMSVPCMTQAGWAVVASRGYIREAPVPMSKPRMGSSHLRGS